MKEYSIRFGEFLPGRKNSTIQCACYFEITPKNPPGSEFCFDVSLSRLDFCALVTRPELGLTVEDAEWVLLKYGLEKTKRELNEGIECDGHEIGLGQGDFPSRPEVSGSDREGLQEFRDRRRVIQHDVSQPSQD
jgi:hypothetical protein